MRLWLHYVIISEPTNWYKYLPINPTKLQEYLFCATAMFRKQKFFLYQGQFVAGRFFH